MIEFAGFFERRIIALERLERLTAWIRTVLPAPLIDLQPASADASFRRYFRAYCETGITS
jgi:N-acetylmuramate 1-kinase